jgi:hypothetical protein
VYLAVLGAVLSVGMLAYLVFSGPRAAVTFGAGYALASAVTGLGTVAVTVADRIAPSMAMAAALTNYLLTVLIFVLVLRTVDPSTLDVAAFVVGLIAAIAPYLAWQVTRARPPK